MPATALPASGEPTPLGPKTCDARGMAEIHRLFRVGFGEAPALVAGVRPGDIAHADVVGGELDLLSGGLHAHHEGEDERLWDALESRAPSCAAHVGRMKDQHAEMLVHLTALDAALPAWRRTAADPDAAPVLAALDAINGSLDVHLGDEETTIVPVMERTLTPKEVDWFGEHGRRSTPRGQTWNQLGAILAAQPDGGDEWLRAHLPAPVRVIWRWVGEPKYRAHRRALLGSTKMDV
ncbi:hemerythrin domain-containing protein [Microbacterium sp. CJ88]|uniref:hemerythrin domain-containing protein n=1 Tax=Microbacterium sp. CJ88 TaxID=3445672 RepID=UPI003F657133